MLCKLRSAPVLQALSRFLASPAYILALSAATAVAHILGLMPVIYALFTLIFVYTCLLGTDLLPAMPVVLFCYIAPPWQHNPGRHPESFVYAGGVYLACLGFLMAASLILRLCTDPVLGHRAFLKKSRKLLPGMLLLTLAYALGGLRTEGFGLQSIAFGLLQGGAIVLPYFLFSGGVDWKRVRKDYFAWIGFAAGCLLVTELLWLYCTKDIVTTQAVGLLIHRQNIYTGWGMYNNLGAMLAMMLPFAFYLASRYNKGWIGTVIGTFFLIGIIFTCSRTSIIFGFAAWLVCILLMILSAKNRRANIFALICAVVLVVSTAILLRNRLQTLFYELLTLGTDPSSRDWLYENAMGLFQSHPLFGTTFYPPTDQSWSWSVVSEFTDLFPARWHSTLLQLLASCGLVGLGAYLFHRYQTLRLFLRGISREKAFIGCSVFVLLGCSLLDCHLFNIGPALFYSMALAFAENCTPPNEHQAVMLNNNICK